MDNPLLSVIIPIYNGEKYLPEAIASIRRQQVKNLEIIVIDDGSTDGTAALVKTLGDDIRYIHQDNAGPAAARNRGLAAARGEFIGFLDVDDLWADQKLAVQLPRLQADPELELVMGRIQYVWLPGTEKTNLLRFREPDNTVVHVHLGGALFRRTVFDKIGVFDATMRYSEDFDWFLRAAEARVKMMIVKAITLHYRLHDRNMTRGKTMHEIYAFRAIKKSLDRRRQRGDIAPLLPWSTFDEALYS